MATQAVCKVDGCGKGGRIVRGLCNKHYLRWQRHGHPEGGRTPNGAAEAYMLARMHDKCPRWPFTRDKRGYARINHSGHRARLVHQVVCEIVHGPRPSPSYEVAHSCGKGAEGCFGASCLSWKLHIENVRDAVAHGTWNHGEKVNFAKLTEAQARAVLAVKPTTQQRRQAGRLAANLGVATETVLNIWQGKTWAWLSRSSGTRAG